MVCVRACRGRGDSGEAGAVYTSRSHHGGEGNDRSRRALASLTDRFCSCGRSAHRNRLSSGMEPCRLGRFALIRAPTTPPPALGRQINPINGSHPQCLSAHRALQRACQAFNSPGACSLFPWTCIRIPLGDSNAVGS